MNRVSSKKNTLAKKMTPTHAHALGAAAMRTQITHVWLLANHKLQCVHTRSVVEKIDP